MKTVHNYDAIIVALTLLIYITLNNGPNNKIFFWKCPLAFCLSLGKVRIVISLLGNELKIIEKNPFFKKGIPYLKGGYTSAC